MAEKLQEISFTVMTIDCITCWPVFQRHLRKIRGIIEVKELPITNKLVVVFDGSLSREAVQEEIAKIADRAGLSGKVVFAR